jgi:hypothetical protein
MATTGSAYVAMNLRKLALALACCSLAGSACASVGLTSATAETPQNNNQGEPTLSQVAPTQAGQAGNPSTGVAGGAAGTTGGVAGTVAEPGSGANGAANPAAGVARPAPPPPPDPATLPVSVIKPVVRAATPEKTPEPGPENAPAPGESVRQSRAPVAAAEPKPVSDAAPVAAPPRPRPSLAEPVARDADARPVAKVESAPEEPADASASSVIFYSGTGLAAAIMLLSFGAFARGNAEETGRRRSI